MQPGRPRILFVEDHQDTRDLLSLLFEQSNYEVVAVPDLERALTLVSTESFALFVLDSRLPDGSGLELCRRIRETNSVTPILFYSALAHATDRQEALNSGAQVYLVKPTSISVLMQTIEDLCSLSRATGSTETGTVAKKHFAAD